MSNEATVRVKSLYTVIDRRAGHLRPPLLSVSASRGVIPRSEIVDGEHRADDLGIYKVCEAGDIVINRMSAYQGALGVSKQRGLVSPDYMVLRPGSACDSRYLGYLFKSAWFVGQMTSVVRGIGSPGVANVRTPRINASDLGSIRSVVPPLDEQRRIADYLDAEISRVDYLAAGQRRVLELLAERRSSTVFSLVSGLGGDPRKRSRLAWMDTIPESWDTARVGLYARMGSGHTPSRSNPEWWANCNIPWITTGEVAQIRDDRRETLSETREKISRIGLANSAAELHPAGTVVLSRTASAGFSAVMGTDMATSQDFATWTCGPQLDPYYLLWCLRAMRSDLLQRLAMGSTHKTIYFPDLQGIRIPLPPLDEQRKIVAQIRRSNHRVDQLVDTIARQLDLLAERRRALITAAVTGQLDVTTARSGVRV